MANRSGLEVQTLSRGLREPQGERSVPLEDSKGRSPWRAFGDFPRDGKVTLGAEHGFAMLGAPGDFLTKRKSPKIRQEPPGSWTSGEGGGSKSVPLLLLPPLIPRLSALAVLVAEVKSLRHPQGSLAA